MKKKIFAGIAILAIVAMTAFNLNLNVENNDVSPLTLANLEALADSENNEGKGKDTKQKVKTFEYDDKGNVIRTNEFEEPCCTDGSSFPCSYKRCG